MKRSDMLNKIAAIVNDHDGYPPAYKILDAMEEAGMLPPTTNLSKLGVSDNAWDEE